MAMTYFLIGQILEALFAVGGVVVFGLAIYDFFLGEYTDSPWEKELDFIPKSLKRHL